MLKMTKVEAGNADKKTYKEWLNCYKDWKVTYDEEDCQNIFTNEK